MVRFTKTLARLVGLDATGTLHQEAGNDLQAVGDPVLDLLKDDSPFPDQLIILPSLFSSVCRIREGKEQANLFGRPPTRMSM